MSEKLILPKSDAPAMFDAIAARYDLLNRILSLGQDLRWREVLKDNVPDKDNLRILDVATGTGDVLIAIARGARRSVDGIGIDPSREMLAIGRQKIKAAGLEEQLTLQDGDAQALAFQDGTFDVVTVSFGIRNVPDLRLGLLEIYRVLKTGGRVLILEFSKPANPFLSAGHWLYMNGVVPVVGYLLSGHGRAYRYLNQTVAQFPYGDRFCKILTQFGFIKVQARPLMGGVATLYAAEK